MDRHHLQQSSDVLHFGKANPSLIRDNRKNMEYVINLTTRDLAFAADWCGVKSGAKVDKFKEMKLTPVKATRVSAPLIKESPVSIECVVKEIKELGSHHMFISEIIAVNVKEAV